MNSQSSRCRLFAGPARLGVWRFRCAFALWVLGAIAFCMPTSATYAYDISTDRTIQEIEVLATYARIRFLPAGTNADGCSGGPMNPSEYAVIDWSTNAENKNLLAQALAAFHGGSKIGFSLNGCSGGAPLATRIAVKP
jgi:hypothetical protein